MNRVHSSPLSSLLRGCIVAAPLLVMGGAPAFAADSNDRTACVHSNRIERLAAKADESPTELRRYVTRTYPVHLVDVAQANEQVARFRQVEAACTARVAAK